MHTNIEIKSKIKGFKEYLEMQKGSYLTQDKIDQCNQFISELEMEVLASKK